MSQRTGLARGLTTGSPLRRRRFRPQMVAAQAVLNPSGRLVALVVLVRRNGSYVNASCSELVSGSSPVRGLLEIPARTGSR